MMSDLTSQGSQLQFASAPRGSQDSASAEASTAAGLPSGHISVGWDPFEVWLQRIEQPRRRRGRTECLPQMLDQEATCTDFSKE